MGGLWLWDSSLINSSTLQASFVKDTCWTSKTSFSPFSTLTTQKTSKIDEHDENFLIMIFQAVEPWVWPKSIDISTTIVWQPWFNASNLSPIITKADCSCTSSADFPITEESHTIYPLLYYVRISAQCLKINLKSLILQHCERSEQSLLSNSAVCLHL